MKKFALILFLVTSVFAAQANVVDTIALFDNTHFDGWVYNRNTVPLSSSNIMSNKINLYGDYCLTSPLMDSGGADSISISVKTHSNINTSSYNPTQGSPTFTLIDANGNELTSVFYKFEDAQEHRTFTVTMDLCDIEATNFKLQLSCRDANLNSALAIREVIVESLSSGIVVGDADGDGMVTSADVTVLYNYLLNNDSSGIANGDQDGDGFITSGDITIVYNTLLGSK